MPMGALTPNVGYSESRNEDNRGVEDFYKANKHLFADGKIEDPLLQHMGMLQSVWQM